MLVKVNYGLNQVETIKVKDIELTEDVKVKIKEKMINDLVYKNILTEISIKCSEMTKIQTEEEINYLTKNNINKNDIMEVLI